MQLAHVIHADRGALSQEERKFNRKISALGYGVERAFSLLKAWWRLVYQKSEQQTRTLNKTVVIACILHNICLEQGDMYENNDKQLEINDGNEGQYLAGCHENGTEIREALKNFIWDNL